MLLATALLMAAMRKVDEEEGWERDGLGSRTRLRSSKRKKVIEGLRVRIKEAE